MKTNVTTFHILYVLFLVVCFSFIFSSGYAQELYEERQYEPIVLCGFTLSKFYDVPIDEIYMYAYCDSSWSLIPFQIDEKTYGPDSMNTRIKRWWYFIPEWWANVDSIGINSHDGLLTGHDELVFMIADLGDKASASDWIDNDESKNYQRLEIEVTDPFNENRKAYGYLYRSSSIGEDIPRPYDFRINLADHIVENNRYSIRISQQTGLIEDVVIKPPYGSGVDIFDTQKIRFAGILNFGQFTIPIGKGGNPAANERDNLYIYQHTIHYTADPVVRVVREVKQSMRFGNYPLDQLSFYVVTKFYPCNGTLEGGADLDPNKLKDLFGTEEDIIIQLDLLRESWDFNAATSGMKFYNRYNNGVSIDGVLDEVVKTIDVPIKEWFLTTGNQGTMFTQIEFQDTSWMGIELYFYDSQQGGQGDGMYVPGIDTGDSLSFGDQGILFTNLTQDSVNLKLGFNAYFLEKNLPGSFGAQLSDWLNHPVIITSQAHSYQTGVDDQSGQNQPGKFELYQNYPNPFNSMTRIKFSLAKNNHVTLKIFDITGRTVKTLMNKNLKAGVHQVLWDGFDDSGEKAASGLYVYKIITQDHRSSRKLVLLY